MEEQIANVLNSVIDQTQVIWHRPSSEVRPRPRLPDEARLPTFEVDQEWGILTPTGCYDIRLTCTQDRTIRKQMEPRHQMS